MKTLLIFLFSLMLIIAKAQPSDPSGDPDVVTIPTQPTTVPIATTISTTIVVMKWWFVSNLLPQQRVTSLQRPRQVRVSKNKN